MPNESALVLLHLSDLHFARPDQGHYWNSAESTETDDPDSDKKGLLERLIQDPMLGRYRPSLVVVSGDLLDKADPSGVPLAVNFLDGLAEKLSLDQSRFALVPGNHDVCRDPSVGYRHFDDIYWSFYGSRRQNFIGKLGYERADLFDYPEHGISIAGFNSCENLDGTNLQGSIGEAQRDAMGKRLASVEQRPLRIAAMHHHLEQPQYQVKRDVSVMNDPLTMRAWLRQKAFSLVLHGHQHVDWQTTAEIDDWRLTIAAAGSLGVASYGRKKWELPLSYQIIVISNAREGLRLRREYSVSARKWGQASSGVDGKNRPIQPLRFGSLRGQPSRFSSDPRRFLPAFEALLKVTPSSSREKIDRHKEAAMEGSKADICRLCADLCETLDLLAGKSRRDVAEAAKRLLCRIILDVPLTPNPIALPPIRLYTNDLEAVPVATYLYLAILVAHAQGAASVELQLDPKFGLVGKDALSPGLLSVAPTLKDAVHEFEKMLWETIREDKTESYDSKCDCTPIECQEHRMLGDLEGLCNQNCRRFRLYAELEGRSASGHRMFAAVDATADTRVAWSEVASNITSVSLLRFGSVGAAQRPPDEDKVHYALKTFFEKADGKQGKRANR